MPTGFVQLPVDSTGKKLRTSDKGTPGHDQYVIPTDERSVSFHGRVCTFKTPGRAAVSQKIGAIHNATGSTVKVRVDKISVDLLSTVAKAVTVIPPVIRVYKFTALPTGGTALTKRGLDSTLTSNASVTVWGDASADKTSSATTLTITPVDLIAQEYAPRIISAAGVEIFDRTSFFDDDWITLNALEGVVVFLEDAVATTGIPATDWYLVTFDWEEYTLP